MDSIAYHLRQDGEYFPITAHIYCSGDGTLMGEAEAAEFLLATNSAGENIANLVIDTWIGLQILKFAPMTPDHLWVDKFIGPAIRQSQSLMEYKLSDSEMIAIHHNCRNYNTIGELKDYLSEVDIDYIQTDIMTVLNQQFCRVRYGGIYDSHGDPELWFRISSVGVSWTDTIYKFVSEFKHIQKVEYITVCRDRTSSDEISDDYINEDNVRIYRAADGALYLHMPIDEYLSEVHDTRDIFTSTDTRKICFGGKWQQYIWERLCCGDMLYDIFEDLGAKGVLLNIDETWDALTKLETYINCN